MSGSIGIPVHAVYRLWGPIGPGSVGGPLTRASLAVVLLLAACASAPEATPAATPEATSSATATPTPTAAPTPATTPKTTATLPESILPSDEDFHDAPELEALLPAVVAGRPLFRWSVRGANYFSHVGFLTDEELANLEGDLATEGYILDDFSQGTAGRDTSDDPPYFVIVLHVRGFLARDLPRESNLDHPEAGDFGQVMIAGKQVWRGVPEMVTQTEHLRGTPYVYESGEYLFTIVTEDEAWAADALAQLP